MIQQAALGRAAMNSDHWRVLSEEEKRNRRSEHVEADDVL
jgi:hypothetical protein